MTTCPQLTATKLRTAPAHVFCSLLSLTSLNLSNNHLQEVSDLGISASSHNTHCLSTLENLDISYNKLTNLPAQAFGHLTRLTELSLEGNRLSSVDAASLSGLSSLSLLSLSHNQLSSIPQATLVSCAELHTLRLDNNQLTDINGLLTAQNQLRMLNVSANKLQWFDFAFIPKSVEWIDLHDNQIEELGNYYQLGDGFSLQTMDASHNKIRKLSSSSFLSSLEMISLNNNQIEEISANTFMQMDSLSRVQLQHNRLVTLQLQALAVRQREQEGKQL